MHRKKGQDDSSEVAGTSTLLSPFEAVFRDILECYSATRQQLFKLEKWDYRAIFENVVKARFGGDAQRSLDRLREGFQDARLNEIAQGKRYLGDLRGMLWQSIDQICSVLESDSRNSPALAKARQSLQKALKQSDFETAKHTIREVLASLVEVDRNQKTTMEALQNSFKKQMDLLQSELQHVQKELQLDGLTQVNNRATFDQQMKKSAQFAFLTGQKSCLIMLDIDHFKRVNDIYGHPAGDAVIQHFAKAMGLAFSRKTDFVARYGGEEFAVILQGTDLPESGELVTKFLQRIRDQKITHNEQDIAVTCSAGLALFEAGETPELWLQRADRALYEAKQNGRNCMILAKPSIREAG